MTYFADYPDISLRYELTGTGARSLILIHELAGTSESWDLVTPHLTDDFRILSSDQRGAGLSEKVRHPFSAADLVGDIERLVETAALKPPYYVVGIASGAALAVAFATRHAADMAALALCSPALKANPERSQYLLSRSETAMKDGMRAIAEMVFARSYQPEVIKDQAVYDEYRARFLAIDPVSYAFANRVLAEADQEEALLALTCPVLLLAGEHDLMRPPDYVRSLAARKAGISVDVVDSGHIMVLQAPDAVGKRLRDFFAYK